MISTKVELWNLALGHLGVSKPIASETENSTEARACRLFYDTCLEEMLRDFVWPFATKLVPLQLVTTNPSSEWAFAYRYPNDCLMLKRIKSGLRNDNRQSRVPYKIYADDLGSLIYTDMTDAEIEYTKTITNLALCKSDFIIALSYRLAAYIAGLVTGGDPFKRGDLSIKLFQMANNKAKQNAANEEQEEEAPDAELIRARS